MKDQRFPSSPREVYRAVVGLRRQAPRDTGIRSWESAWADEADTLALLREWQDAKSLDVRARWTDRRTLTPHRFTGRAQGARAAFLQRWRDGLRWQHLAVLACMLLLLAAPATASPGRAETFQKANEAYGQGRWEAAAEGYRQLVADGVDDAAVWYDLGNAYAQMDDAGRARACYERALRLAPRDPDVRSNLSVLKQKLPDKEPDDDVLSTIAAGFTRNELAAATSAAWIVTALLLTLWLRGRREALGWLSVLSVGLLLMFGGLYATRALRAPEAVVLPAEVKLFNGPGRDYTSSISLHAGTRVQVLRADGDWREVGALHRVKGWVRAEQLEAL